MEYIIPCRSLFDKSDINIQDQTQVVIANISFQSQTHFCEVYHIASQKRYTVKSNPLKLRNRFQIFEEDKQVANIQVGKNILHSIIESDKYYFVKSAFFKIRYRVYDNRNVITRLQVIRKNTKRYYHITSTHDDFINIIALFLLSEAVRFKSILN